MAEPRKLIHDEEPSSHRPPPYLRGMEPGTLTFLKADKSIQRASLYFFIFVVLLVAAFGPVPPPEVPNEGLHDILESLATLLAFVVGSLALVRFYSKKTGTFLFLGTGFLGSAVLDVFHVLESMGAAGDRSPVAARDLSVMRPTASKTCSMHISSKTWRKACCS